MNRKPEEIEFVLYYFGHVRIYHSPCRISVKSLEPYLFGWYSFINNWWMSMGTEGYTKQYVMECAQCSMPLLTEEDTKMFESLFYLIMNNVSRENMDKKDTEYKQAIREYLLSKNYVEFLE